MISTYKKIFKPANSILLFMAILIITCILLFSCSSTSVRIYKISSDQNGDLIAGLSSGLYIFKNNSRIPQKIFDRGVRDFQIDSKSQIFIAGWDGVYRLKTNDNTLDKLKLEAIDWRFVHFINLYLMNDTTLLISRLNELIKYNLEEDTAEVILNTAREIDQMYVNESDTMFVLTLFDVLHYSIDSGATWQTRELGDIGCWKPVFYNNELYIPTNRYFLYCTSDFGETWKLLGNGLRGVTVFAVVFGENGRIILQNDLSIFYSDDMGENFLETKSNLSIAVENFYKDNSGVIYASTIDNGIYFSTDNGYTWKQFCKKGVFY